VGRDFRDLMEVEGGLKDEGIGIGNFYTCLYSWLPKNVASGGKMRFCLKMYGTKPMRKWLMMSERFFINEMNDINEQ
jgi:hypothetical protein